MAQHAPHCVVCLEAYTLTSQRALRLPCGHTCMCAGCGASGRIKACPLCRTAFSAADYAPAAADADLLPHLSSRCPAPSSFPINGGALDGDDDAPGTPPYPLAGAGGQHEAQPAGCEVAVARSLHGHTCSTGTSSSSDSSSSSSGSGRHDAVNHTNSSRASSAQQQAPRHDKRRRKQAGAAAAAAAGSDALNNMAGDAACTTLPARARHNNRTTAQPSAATADGPQALQHRGLLSFPLEPSQDDDTGCVAASPPAGQQRPCDSSPGSSSWSELRWRQQQQQQGALAPAAAAAPAAAMDSVRASRGSSITAAAAGGLAVVGGDGRAQWRSGHTAAVWLVGVLVQQGAGAGVALLRQVFVPWPAMPPLLQPAACTRTAAPSLVVAAAHSWRDSWAAFSGALQRSLDACRTAQQRSQAAAEALMCRAGMPGAGQLAWCAGATMLLGVLLHQWQLGMALSPVCAAALALSAAWGMSGSAAAAGAVAEPATRHQQLVWPSQAALALLAGDCLVLSLQRATGLGAAPLLCLLAATPRVLALAALLAAGQVVLDVLHAGWRSAAELRHTSLLCRCWCVAAVGVLCAGHGASSSSSLSMLAAAAAWAQKAHMLLVEGPLLVLQLAPLLSAQQHVTRSGSNDRQPLLLARSTPAAAGAAAQRSADAANSSSSDGGAAGQASALLCCLHCLLQLLVLLFVPPAPLASAAWVPQLLQGGLVWGARVLLCGCCMQLALRGLSGSMATAHALGSSGSSGDRLDHNRAGVAGWCACFCTQPVPALSLPQASAPCMPASPPPGGWRTPAHHTAAGDGGCGAAGSSGGVAVGGRAGSSGSSGSSGGAGACCFSTPRASPARRRLQCWDLQLVQADDACAAGQCGSGGAVCDAAAAAAAARDDSTRAGSSPVWSQRALALALPAGDDDSWLMAAWDNHHHHGISSNSSTALQGYAALLWQHAAHLLPLAAAAAGDTFIVTTAAGGGAAAAAVRGAWQRLVQRALVALLCCEAATAARREVAAVLVLARLPAARGGVLPWSPARQHDTCSTGL